MIDPAADAHRLTSVTFNSNPAVIYQDANIGALKIALWNGKIWSKLYVDGRGGSAGRTRNPIAGDVSACVSGFGKSQILHIFYSDSVDKDLRYATYDGKVFKYEIIDGNGTAVNNYEDPIRIRTASDVSVANACSVSSSGVQVFYRDESQGILLGAVKDKNEWRYEIVDGDKDTEDRTTGDVAFHMKAITVGKKIHLIYDSVRGFDLDRNVTRGDIRYATRSSAFVEDWSYKTLDTPGEGVAVAGYDVSVFNAARGVNLGWFTGSGVSFPDPNQVRYQTLLSSTISNVSTTNYGVPNSPIEIDEKSILFGCNLRLCSINKADKSISLVSSGSIKDGGKSNWINVNKIRYAVAGVSGKLTLFKP